jgi:hypothetical protein
LLLSELPFASTSTPARHTALPGGLFRSQSTIVAGTHEDKDNPSRPPGPLVLDGMPDPGGNACGHAADERFPDKGLRILACRSLQLAGLTDCGLNRLAHRWQIRP